MGLEDTNHDGKLSAQDAHWKELQVWVDANHDGKTDKGELHGLADFGIVELDLHATKGTAMDNGNLLGLVSSYSKADGSQHAMVDVWFAKDVTPVDPTKHAPVALGDVLSAPSADLLPTTATAQANAQPGTHTASAANVTQATASPHMAIDKRLLTDEEQKSAPLI